MKIGLIQIDGKIPNIALMKIASFHKSQGNDVEWWNGPLFPYDKIYASKIFDFSDDYMIPEEAIKGGTGYSVKDRLPEEMDRLNHSGGWFLYPRYHNHIGFSQRGCRLSCSFCVVPEKEGKPRPDLSISQLLSNPNGKDRLVLLDDDFLGHSDCEDIFQELIDRKLKVCFCQGLNIRLITENQASLLSKTRFYNPAFSNRLVTFAWDRFKDRKIILKGFKRCIDAGIKPYQIQFFVLIGYDTTPDEDMERIESISELGSLPFVMPYDKWNSYQKSLAGWVNNRAVFRSVKWDDYKYKDKTNFQLTFK